MTVYLIAEVKVTDDSWIPDYASRVPEIAARHNGRYLSRSANVETIEGEAPDQTGIALLAFPSREDVLALANDPEYAPLGEARRAGSICHYRLIDDTDIAGAIPYLQGTAPNGGLPAADPASYPAHVDRSREGRDAREEYSPMTVFLIAEVKVTDDAWIPDYAARVHDIAAKHEGRYLSRSGNIETLEGEQTDETLIALIQFPTREAAMGFVNDPEYAPYGEARKAGSVSHFRLIDDTDLAGTIPYLAKPASA